MDSRSIGALIRAVRREKGMTQRELGEVLHVSDRAVSKWERDRGCPDISLLPSLSNVLGVDLERMLSGDLEPDREKGDSMKRIEFYVCPVCGNVIAAAEKASIACCGRKLTALTPQKAEGVHTLAVEEVEDEWLLTTEHPHGKGTLHRLRGLGHRRAADLDPDLSGVGPAGADPPAGPWEAPALLHGARAVLSASIK